MYYHKYPLPSNFQFAHSVRPNGQFETALGTYQLELSSLGTDIHRIRVVGHGWEQNDSEVELTLPEACGSEKTHVTIQSDGSFTWTLGEGGSVLLHASPGRFFGQCGRASVFEFVHYPEDRLYGMGEKWTGFEHSGKTHKFWNTDVWADFNPAAYIHGKPAPDPTYLSVPYVIVKRGENYVGMLMNNPHATFISSAAKRSIAGQMEIDEEVAGTLHFGAEQGQPDLYFMYGPSLPELTRKLQQLVGVTPLPPAWALGYQQCRWGYTSESDLLELDANFTKHEIPVDGLWLDIDYMEGFRVFTFADQHFKDLEGTLAKLTANKRMVVPILDPGVKHDPDYAVYQSGLEAGAFCLNPQGMPYTGLVWPGETHFPDFSTETGREWWAAQVAEFASQGIYGAWLDMNDPATGPAESEQMLFKKGEASHSSYHSQYALGMAQATREGFLRAHPDRRPFTLSRSGFTGSGRYTAIWTGDNFSNYYHLKNSVAVTLNLALSGIPFNGADVGGFGGDATPQLICDWFKAAFLFPVFRNHSIAGSRHQEPWAFDEKTLDVLRYYIRLRYRLRPYLYQLFVQHEQSGDAILRPLFYDFEGTADLQLDRIDDAFMVGPSILQAPFLDENLECREVVLPGPVQWYDLQSGAWLKAPNRIEVKADALHTPMFVRDGAVLPLARLKSGEHRYDSKQIEFHLFLTDGKESTLSYQMDDGQSFKYQNGQRSVVELNVSRKGDRISIQTQMTEDAFGSGDFCFTTETVIQSVEVNGVSAEAGEPQGLALGASPMQTWLIRK